MGRLLQGTGHDRLQCRRGGGGVGESRRGGGGKSRRGGGRGGSAVGVGPLWC
ncbi:hypothetical protein KCH_47300 [Kitasatospora cheerisanensis KCTC 2395]|uniref:Uncharacterized protein n=1 Tax=Kitasatospora cheerisanensis KCTC 2395 TaxID=1348663 RepID=A0A066YNZ5_9ACTN|nr:hypothetical protein KCH_47300 [Kitasatospora cheerisanensis KCTC 2395]